jgi:hypothetical protein
MLSSRRIQKSLDLNFCMIDTASDIHKNPGLPGLERKLCFFPRKPVFRLAFVRCALKNIDRESLFPARSFRSDPD